MCAKPKAVSRGGANPLGTAPIGSLILKFSIPSIIAMLVNSAYNITDQIFIGHVVGMLGNGATNAAFPTVLLATSLALLAGIGASANFNISLGAREEEKAKLYVGTGLTLTALLGLLLGAVVLLFTTPILLLCGATEASLPYAQAYLGITALGLPFQLFTSSGNVLIRADRSPLYAMLCTVSGASLNVFLDWLFMYILHWGIRGAAAATAVSQFISFLLCLRYFTRFNAFPIQAAYFGLPLRYVLQILKLGLSECLNQLAMMLVNIVMNNTLTFYGALTVYGKDIPLAVSGLAAKINSLLVALTVGLAQGCHPIWSFNKGARQYERVRSTYMRAAVIAMCLSIFVFFLFQIFPRQIISIFGSGDALYFDFAEQYLRIYMLMVCLFGLQPIAVNYFNSIGDVKHGLFLCLSRQGLFLVPLLLILPRFFGLNGALYAGPIADTLAFLLALLLSSQSFRSFRGKPG